MGIIILIGLIYMAVNGNWVQCILFLMIAGIANSKHTDKNRRGGWWK